MIGEIEPMPELNPRPSAVPPIPAEVSVQRAESPSVDAGSPAGETPPIEIGGREGLEPTRYGDWEKNGRCIDF